ncbi:MAG: hypothetical protein COA44_15610 [Arcobacter sp.]|nr:MAG: hypothetical protein COA44_15610 [Arcobacter sp.]
MQKILILGGSHRDIPLIQASQELGYFVITLANRDEYLGHRYADKYYKIDFNDLEAVEKIYHREKVSYLIPGCGEESYLSTVTLAHKLNTGNFDPLEIAQLVHNKWKFKEFCLRHNISTPKGIYYKDNLANIALAFPIVVKPTNLSGGRGVQIVKNQIELSNALKESSEYSNEIFLEEFIEGELIACSVILKNQRISYSFFGADKSYLNSYLITTAYPISINTRTKHKLFKDIETVADKLHLKDGMFHLQIIIKNEIPYIIDVTRRIPGDLYPKLIEYCDGIEYSKAVIESYLGEKITANLIRVHKPKKILRHCVMPKDNANYQTLLIDESLQKNIIYRLDLLKEGSVIHDYLHTQIAIVFIELDNYNNTIREDINTLIYPILKDIT